MVLMVYVTSKGPRSDCLLADMKQIDQTTKVIRHLAPLDDFFFFFLEGGGGGGGGGATALSRIFHLYRADRS